MALKNLLFSLAFLLNCNLFLAQTGAISGKLVDSATDETIPGVKVTIDGLTGKGAMTDLDGIFVIQSVPVGTYSLSFVYNGYNSKIITDVEVKEKDTNSMLVGLDKIVREIGQITVKVTVNKESNENLIRMQRNSAQVVDGITAESIKRSTDSKASDVLKRVSGASVQDNKFVVVRGLSDRYNFALINGASLPSSESDRKAFSFDIFPSNMLDNLVIIKTATPEMPGEFAGGVIDINTTEPKEKNFHSIQLSGAFNTLTTFKDFATYDGGKLDFLGMGSSSRSIPNGIPATEDFSSISKDEKGEYTLEEAKAICIKLKDGARIPTLDELLCVYEALMDEENNKLTKDLKFKTKNVNYLSTSLSPEGWPLSFDFNNGRSYVSDEQFKHNLRLIRDEEHK
jgi:hypothetical protein